MEVKCDNCGKSFHKELQRFKRSKNHFCSVGCKNQWRERKILVPCPGCGVDMVVVPYLANKKNHFCSRQCYYGHKGNKKVLRCDQCGKDFLCLTSRAKIYNKHFCSRECTEKYRSKGGANTSGWKGGKIKVSCDSCGATLIRWPSMTAKYNFCNMKCRSTYRRRDNHPNWKGGFFFDHGYKYVKCPPEYAGMQNQAGYVSEARLVAAKKIGRALTAEEIPHHLNGIKTDNRPSNIMLFSSRRATCSTEMGQGKGKYHRVKCPPEYASMSYINGQINEHRLVMAKKLGRPLRDGERPHHIDGNKGNNDPSNLELMESNSVHMLHEWAQKKTKKLSLSQVSTP